MFVSTFRGEAVEVIFEDFGGTEDDAEGGSELVGDHGDEAAFQFAEFAFLGEGTEKFLLRSFAGGDDETEDEEAGFSVEFDRVGRHQDHFFVMITEFLLLAFAPDGEGRLAGDEGQESFVVLVECLGIVLILDGHDTESAAFDGERDAEPDGGGVAGLDVFAGVLEALDFV